MQKRTDSIRTACLAAYFCSAAKKSLVLVQRAASAVCTYSHLRTVFTQSDIAPCQRDPSGPLTSPAKNLFGLVLNASVSDQGPDLSLNTSWSKYAQARPGMNANTYTPIQDCLLGCVLQRCCEEKTLVLQ